MADPKLTYQDLDNEKLADNLRHLADRIEERSVTGVEFGIDVSSGDIPVATLTIERELLDGDQAFLDMVDFESPEE